MSEMRSLSELRPHPENATIFGDPSESDQFKSILESIRKFGIWEPLIIKSDGTILSGHLRRLCAERLKLKSVPVRVHEPFAAFRDEVAFVIRSNTDRRQLTKWEIALAFKRLKELPKEQGGTKKKMGRPPKGQQKSPAKRGLSKDASAEDAASVLGVGKDEARALETVFTTPGVPDELKRAVNDEVIAPTPAAKAVRTEAKRQGGTITDPSALRAMAQAKAEPPKSEDHSSRMAKEAERYRQDYRELFDVYKRVDGLLTRRPLKSVLGPTEHHEYGTLVRDIAMRAWREVESVQGPSNAGRQMSLAVITGGKS